MRGDWTIKDILDYHLPERGGLDFVAFAHTDAENDLNVALERYFEAKLNASLKRFGVGGRNAAEQVEHWRELIPKVHEAMMKLDRSFLDAGQGKNVRVVFDVDMGGIYYTRIGDYGFVFGASLDQAEVNSRRCEDDMRKIVAEIEALFTAHGA